MDSSYGQMSLNDSSSAAAAAEAAPPPAEGDGDAKA